MGKKERCPEDHGIRVIARLNINMKQITFTTLTQ